MQRPAQVTINATRGVRMTKKEETIIEQLAEEAERVIEPDYEKRDLKESRAVLKEKLFDGSKKLKHRIPKGVRSS